MKIVIPIILVIIALGVFAICVAHRDNCEGHNEVGCTLVPWSGHHRPAPKPNLGGPFGGG